MSSITSNIAIRLMIEDMAERKTLSNKDGSSCSPEEILEYYLGKAKWIQRPVFSEENKTQATVLREAMGWNKDCFSNKHNPEAYYCPDCQP